MLGGIGRVGRIGRQPGRKIQPLRVAAVQNRILASTSQRTGASRMICRWAFQIGSGNFSQLVFNNSNMIFIEPPAGTGNAVTIEKMALEKGDNSVSTPVTFNGVRSLVMANGDYDLNSDPVYPAALGLSSFSRGQMFWIRIEISVASNNLKIPIMTVRQRTEYSGQSVGWFDPGATTLTNGVDGVGAYTVSGTALDTSGAGGYCPMVLGRFVSGDPKTYIFTGDSIIAGIGDSTSALNGKGVGQRALTDSDGTSNGFASINLTVSGQESRFYQRALYNNAFLYAYMKYARILVDELATNDIAPIGAQTVAATQGFLSEIYAGFKAAQPAGQIVRMYLLAQTTSTDSWATTANQTIATDWGAGEKSEQLNNWSDARLADGTINAVVGRSALNDGSQPYKWAVTGAANFNTADGLHPSTVGHGTRAGELRTVMAGLS